MNLTQKDHALLLAVKVVPNASRTQLAGLLGDALKIKVAQPLEDGKANKAVEALLADLLQIAPSHVSVVAGHTRPHKTLRILTLTETEARTRLTAALNA